MTALLRALARHRAGRFLIDFWFDPWNACRRYTQKRTWPTREQFDRMSNDEFGAYLASIGKRRPA